MNYIFNIPLLNLKSMEIGMVTLFDWLANHYPDDGLDTEPNFLASTPRRMLQQLSDYTADDDSLDGSGVENP